MFLKYMALFIFIFIIIATTFTGTTSACSNPCSSGYSSIGDYCYQYFPPNQTTYYAAVQQCALQSGVLPTFRSQQQYLTYRNLTYSINPVIWLGYVHKKGVSYQINDVVSMYDGQTLQVVYWDGGSEPNFYGSTQWCFINTNRGLYDYDCNHVNWTTDLFATYCQQAQTLNCLPYQYMPCSMVCQVDSGYGYLYSASYVDCMKNNKSAAEYSKLGYAFPLHIPGYTDAVYQMRSNITNNTVMVIGLSQMTTMMNQAYKVQNVFFVPLTVIVSGMEKYSLLHNSASLSTATKSFIVKYSDPLYTNLTQNGWFDKGVFYLYQNQTNGTCNIYEPTSTSTTSTRLTSTTTLLTTSTTVTTLKTTTTTTAVTTTTPMSTVLTSSTSSSSQAVSTTQKSTTTHQLPISSTSSSSTSNSSPVTSTNISSSSQAVSTTQKSTTTNQPPSSLTSSSTSSPVTSANTTAVFFTSTTRAFTETDTNNTTTSGINTTPGTYHGASTDRSSTSKLEILTTQSSVLPVDQTTTLKTAMVTNNTSAIKSSTAESSLGSTNLSTNLSNFFETSTTPSSVIMSSSDSSKLTVTTTTMVSASQRTSEGLTPATSFFPTSNVDLNLTSTVSTITSPVSIEQFSTLSAIYLSTVMPSTTTASSASTELSSTISTKLPTSTIYTSSTSTNQTFNTTLFPTSNSDLDSTSKTTITVISPESTELSSTFTSLFVATSGTSMINATSASTELTSTTNTKLPTTTTIFNSGTSTNQTFNTTLFLTSNSDKGSTSKTTTTVISPLSTELSSTFTSYFGASSGSPMINVTSASSIEAAHTLTNKLKTLSVYASSTSPDQTSTVNLFSTLNTHQGSTSVTVPTMISPEFTGLSSSLTTFPKATSESSSLFNASSSLTELISSIPTKLTTKNISSIDLTSTSKDSTAQTILTSKEPALNSTTMFLLENMSSISQDLTPISTLFPISGIHLTSAANNTLAKAPFVSTERSSHLTTVPAIIETSDVSMELLPTTKALLQTSSASFDLDPIKTSTMESFVISTEINTSPPPSTLLSTRDATSSIENLRSWSNIFFTTFNSTLSTPTVEKLTTLSVLASPTSSSTSFFSVSKTSLDSQTSSSTTTIATAPLFSSDSAAATTSESLIIKTLSDSTYLSADILSTSTTSEYIFPTSVDRNLQTSPAETVLFFASTNSANQTSTPNGVTFTTDTINNASTLRVLVTTETQKQAENIQTVTTSMYSSLHLSATSTSSERLDNTSENSLLNTYVYSSSSENTGSGVSAYKETSSALIMTTTLPELMSHSAVIFNDGSDATFLSFDKTTINAYGTESVKPTSTPGAIHSSAIFPSDLTKDCIRLINASTNDILLQILCTSTAAIKEKTVKMTQMPASLETDLSQTTKSNIAQPTSPSSIPLDSGLLSLLKKTLNTGNQLKSCLLKDINNSAIQNTTVSPEILQHEKVLYEKLEPSLTSGQELLRLMSSLSNTSKGPQLTQLLQTIIDKGKPFIADLLATITESNGILPLLPVINNQSVECNLKDANDTDQNLSTSLSEIITCGTRLIKKLTGRDPNLQSQTSKYWKASTASYDLYYNSTKVTTTSALFAKSLLQLLPRTLNETRQLIALLKSVVQPLNFNVSVSPLPEETTRQTQNLIRNLQAALQTGNQLLSMLPNSTVNETEALANIFSQTPIGNTFLPHLALAINTGNKFFASLNTSVSILATNNNLLPFLSVTLDDAKSLFALVADFSKNYRFSSINFLITSVIGSTTVSSLATNVIYNDTGYQTTKSSSYVNKRLSDITSFTSASSVPVTGNELASQSNNVLKDNSNQLTHLLQETLNQSSQLFALINDSLDAIGNNSSQNNGTLIAAKDFLSKLVLSLNKGNDLLLLLSSTNDTSQLADIINQNGTKEFINELADLLDRGSQLQLSLISDSSPYVNSLLPLLSNMLNNGNKLQMLLDNVMTKNNNNAKNNNTKDTSNNKISPTTSSCIVGNWSACSATCGNGTMQRILTCESTSTNEIQICPDLLKCNPMSEAEYLLARIVSAIGCAWCIATTTSSFVANCCLRSYKFETLLHMGEEMTLALAHVLIAFLVTKTDLKELCAAVSICLQFLFTSSSLLFLTEAIQTYFVYTNVISFGQFIPTKLAGAICFAIPAALTTGTAALGYSSLTSDFSCFINYDSNTKYVSILSFGFTNMATIVLIEACGHQTAKKLPLTDDMQSHAAIVNRHALLATVPLNVTSWILMTLGLYYQHIAWFAAIFGINVALGWKIFLTHFLANPKVKILIDNIKAKYFKK